MRVSNLRPASPLTTGMGLFAHRHQSLLKLAQKARRFFGPEAVAEVWEEMEPGLRAEGGGACGRFEALAWLSLLLPTQDVCR